MTMLPRNMISPIVSPSAGTSLHRRGSITVMRFLEHVANALAAVQARLLGERFVSATRCA